MNKSESILNLSAALVKAQADIGGAVKDAANPYFKSSYADLGEVIHACKGPLLGQGITVSQLVTETEKGPGLETMLLHESGEWISSVMPIVCAKEKDPQALGSAITYARRYALQSALFIPAVDDDAEAAMYREQKPAHPVKGADPRDKKMERAMGGWVDDAPTYEESPVPGVSRPPEDFRETRIHFGKNRGLMLSELTPFQRKWYSEDWLPKKEQGGGPTSIEDLALMDALKQWRAAAGASQEPRQGTKPAPAVSTPQTGSWKAVKVHIAHPAKGATLGELPPSQRDELRAKMEEKAKLGTRNLSTADKKLIAALAMELGERKPSDPDDEISMFNGPNHQKLHDALVFAEISEEDFMATAHDAKWIPEKARDFSQMSDETAKGFVENFEDVPDSVDIYLNKRNVSKS